MRSAWQYGSAVALGVWALACSAAYPEGRIACEGASECPRGWVCEARQGGPRYCYASATDAGQSDTGVTDGAVVCTGASDCDDGLFCNGPETCDPTRDDANAMGCVAGMRSCADDVACTLDACDEDHAACTHTAPDQDGDGHADITCVDGSGEALGDDCDDDDAARFPGNSEVCDEHDEDCDPATLGLTDHDGDGVIADACCNTDAQGVAHCGGDCNDDNIAQRRGQPEFCDDVDNDCDGTSDNDTVEVAWFADSDGDGFGDANDSEPMRSCAVMAGRSVLNTDCDDTDPMRHPGQIEICDGADTNCNITDETPECGGLRVRVRGGLASLSPVGTSAVRLREHGFTGAARTCGQVLDTRVCVSGGVVP